MSMTDLLSLLDICRSCFTSLLLTLPLLQQSLWNHDLVLGGDGSVWYSHQYGPRVKGRRVGTAAYGCILELDFVTRRNVFNQ